MDKLTAIKIKYDDGTYSDEIPVSVLSENVEWDSTHTLVDVLGSINVDVTGTIQDQISQLFNEKISATQLQNYVASQLNEDVSTWLNNNVDPVGSAVIVDSSLTISGAAADAKKTGDEVGDLKSALSESGTIYQPGFTVLSGAIRGTDGAVIGETPNNHTSDIVVPANCKIVVNAYLYSGLTYIATVENGVYHPIIVANENARDVVQYKAERETVVSVGFYGDNYEITIIKDYESIISDNVSRVSDTLTDNGIGNSFDGKLYNGYWNGNAELISNSIDICNRNKIQCEPDARVVITAKARYENPTYYISYLDDNTRLRRDTGTGLTYSGIAPSGTKYVCFTFEKQNSTIDDMIDVSVFINNKITEINGKIDAIIKSPQFTAIDGIINSNGVVDGTYPNCHTSDISVNVGDIIIVNGFYYAGFSIISKHDGQYYIPLLVSSANERATIRYFVHENMSVSISYVDLYAYDILVIDGSTNQVKSELNQYALNNIVDLSNMSWALGSIDGAGVEFESNSRIRSEMIPVNEGTIISVSGASQSLCVFCYNATKVLTAEYDWISSNTYTVPSDVAFVRILLRVNTANPVIASADIPIVRDRCTIYLKLPRSAFYEISDDGIPSYYKNMMETKAAQIRENMASIGANGDSFIFFTDFHIDSNTLHTPALIKYLMDNCGIKNVVFCGDAINKENTKALAYEKFMVFNQLFESQGVKFKTVVGNHEYNNPSESTDPTDVAIQLTSGEIYPFFVKDEEYDPFATVYASELSYYIDNKTQKIRYLFVPCDYAANITSEAQQFAIEAISSLPSGYGIVVFTHYALQTDGNMRASFVSIANALDTLIGTDKVPICVATGHTHRDLNGKTTGGIPIICTTCDSNVQVLDPSQRPAGTVNEHAFDVYQINMTNRTITLVRIGFGVDRQFTF